MFIAHFPDIQETYKSQEFYNQPMQARVKMSTNEVTLMPHFYPKDYQNKCFGFKFIPDRFIDKDGNHVFTFPYNDSAYIFNSHGLVKQVYFGTAAQHQFSYIPYDRIDDLEHAVFQNILNDNPYYGFAQYLLYSNYYTRLYISVTSAKEKEYTQIFYDENWNYIGEIRAAKLFGFYSSSKHGFLLLNKENNKLFISKISLNT